MPRARPHSQVAQNSPAVPSQGYSSVPRRYFHIGAGLVSQCSLHSCTSSELSNAAPTAVGESSANSYTTSLSTDTLYWDGSSENASRVSQKTKTERYSQQAQYSHDPIYVQYNQVKPKSWDNLTTKAFGGYGFGYGYLDASGSKCSQKHNPKKPSSTMQYVRVEKNTPHTQRRYFQPTKSTESLLSVPKYSNEKLNESSLSCECLNPSLRPSEPAGDSRLFPSRQGVLSPSDPNFGYYSASRRASRADPPSGKPPITTSSEATRL